MSGGSFTIDLLGNQDRAAFSCGVEVLDRYFHTQVGQDTRRRVTACYVATEADTGHLAGYYTLSAADIALADIPPALTRKLPRYPTVPAARLGRLAVDRRYQGRGLGITLVVNAAARAARSEIAVFALVVEAKDDQAEAFYQHHGFIPSSVPRQLMASIEMFKELL